jgi:hypothetical protein
LTSTSREREERDPKLLKRKTAEKALASPLQQPTPETYSKK